MSLTATYVQYCTGTKHVQLKTVHADFFFKCHAKK